MDCLTGSNLEVVNTSSIRSQCKRIRNQPLPETELEVPAKRMKLNHIKKEVFEFETSCVQRMSDTENRVRNATPSVTVKSEPLDIEIPSFLTTKTEQFADEKITCLKTEFMPFMTENKEIHRPPPIFIKSEPQADEIITSLTTELTPFMPSVTKTEEIAGPPPEPLAANRATLPIKNKPAINVERTRWKKPVPLVDTGIPQSTNELRPLLFEHKATETTQSRTPVPLVNPRNSLASISRTANLNTVPANKHGRPAKQKAANPNANIAIKPAKTPLYTNTATTTKVLLANPRNSLSTLPQKANSINTVTDNKYGRAIKQKTSKPLANRAKQPSNANSTTNTRCELKEELQTAEHKQMYQITALDQLKSHRRPGHSILQLKHFTSSLEVYVENLKIIDPRFMHSPSIMRAVCSKLEPYILSSWCDYAAHYAKNGKPLILTMVDFLHQKVNSGFRYWYPYTREGANRNM